MNENRCIFCNEIIPEGRIACPLCSDPPEQNVIDFGKLCENWRTRNNITRIFIARQLDVTESCVWRFERENRHNYKLLSWYISHGCNLTFEMTRRDIDI